MITTASDAKRALRALLRDRRPSGDHAALCRSMLSFPLPERAVVAGSCPLPGEPDSMPVWAALHDRGHPIVMPETTAPGAALRFRLWRPGDALLPGRFGTRHPPGPDSTPEVVFVPLLCWDLGLNRLGYGGGYYDRTLAALPRALAVGFGFEAQQVALVPTGPFDIPLGAIVTETRILFAKDRPV